MHEVEARPTGNVVRRRLSSAVVAGAALFALGVWIASRPAGQPKVISAAVSQFRAGGLPATDGSGPEAPDLSSLELVVQGASSTALAGARAQAVAYRRPDGRRVHLYLLSAPAPIALDALTSVPGGPWVASVGGVELLGATIPRPFLALSEDLEILLRMAATLGVRDLDAIFSGPQGGSGYFVPY